jgi:hypothetical protein
MAAPVPTTSDIISRMSSSEPVISAADTSRTDRRLTAAWFSPKSVSGTMSAPQAMA